MFNLLRKLAGRRDTLVDAGRRTSSEAFTRAIAGEEVLVIAAMQSEGLDATTLTPEQLLAEIERAVQDVGGRKGEFKLFIYDREGHSCLPFFSSQTHVQTFCGEYSKRADRVFPFQILTLSGSCLGSCSSGVDQLVLNDWTPDERPLSGAEKQLLQQWRT